MLDRMVIGYGLSQALYVAAKLGIPDLLAAGPQDTTDLASETGTSAPSLGRILRLLAANDVLAEVSTGRFRLTAVGDLLRSDAEASQRPYVIMTMELEYPAWGHLLDAVRTGQPGFASAFGRPHWEYLANDPLAAASFDAAMVGLTGPQVEAIVAGYDFSTSRSVVEVGGGHGTLLAAIMATHPEIRGVLYDTPLVVEGAPTLLERAGVLDRCRRIGGDFLESVPEGGDTYVLKWIVHDWDDAHATTILRNCRRAMQPGARVLLIESVVPMGNASADHSRVLWDDVLMMVLLGGQERTAPEFGRLMDSAGLTLGGIVPVAPGLCIIEGYPRNDNAA